MCAMTLHAQNDFSISEETVRVACAAYPKGNPYRKLRDELGTIYQDQSFLHLFPDHGRLAQAPWRLAMSHQVITLTRIICLNSQKLDDLLKNRLIYEIKYW